MTRRINQLAPIADHDLLLMLKAWHKTPGQKRQILVSKFLKAYPTLSRDYVTGCVDMMIVKAQKLDPSSDFAIFQRECLDKIAFAVGVPYEEMRSDLRPSRVSVNHSEGPYTGWLLGSVKKTDGDNCFIIEDDAGHLRHHTSAELGLEE